MVDSFNVSVAAGILMHHAVCDRTSRLVIDLFTTWEDQTFFLDEDDIVFITENVKNEKE